MHHIPLADRARCRWSALLPIFGVDAKFLTNRQGPCPLCGGRTRFRFDDKDGTGSWICNHCGAGDGVKLVQLINGWEFKEAAQHIERHLGDAEVRIAKPTRRSQERDKELLRKTWKESKPITADTAAGRYLARRIGPGPYSRALRSCDSLYCAPQDEGGDATRRPAMLALVQAADGSNATLHRTYLALDGQQAPIRQPKRVMSPMGTGVAVRLSDATDVLGIAEGIETALAAQRMFGIPCWAALNAGQMALWMPPKDVTRVVVFGDCDTSYVGQRAAFTLAARLKDKCRDTLKEVTVEIPEMVDGDWADVWFAQHRGLAAEALVEQVAA